MTKHTTTGKHSTRTRVDRVLVRFTSITAAMLVFTIVAGLVASGVTYAWMRASDSVENTMPFGTQKVIVTEKFDPPEHWNPGDETPKEVSFTNSGDTGALIRVRYNEYWTAADGATLSNVFVNPSTSSPEDVALKTWTAQSFTNASLWRDGGDGYFYYTKVLPAGVSTSAVLDAVMFNPAILDTDYAVDYLGGAYRLEFFVESLNAKASPEAIKGEFGTYVSAAIDASNNVTWTFAP